MTDALAAPSPDAFAAPSLDNLGPVASGILAEIETALDRNAAAARTGVTRLRTLLRALPVWSGEAAAETASEPSRGGLAPWQLKRIAEFVRDNLDDRIRVEDLADRARLSPSHFCRAFKTTTGETPHAHVMRLRLEKAQAMMLETEETLSQIADACGLADQAHLTRLFRQRIGATPYQWRRMHRIAA